MNLIPVTSIEGKVVAENGIEFKIKAPRPGALTLGVRAEDMHLCSAEESTFSSKIFAFELLGDATMITLKLGVTAVAIKADKNLRLKFGELVNIKLDQQSLFWFDHDSGARIRQQVQL